MSAESSENGKKLHLPDLTIKGFRGFENLEIKRLGRVNLIVGKNSVGKSSLLDAVKVYATRARHETVANVLSSHDEVNDAYDSHLSDEMYPVNRETLLVDWDALFHGRGKTSHSPILIGSNIRREYSRIEIGLPDEEEAAQLDTLMNPFYLDEDVRVMRVTVNGHKHLFPTISFRNSRILRSIRASESRLPPEIKCTSLGSDLIDYRDMTTFWDNVVTESQENRAVDALNLIFHGDINSVVMVGDNGSGRGPYRRRVLVGIKGERRRIPLKSLGEGATRMFGVALALANSRDGFLLIDEVENGLHWSIQYDFWRMVIRTAHENNVQVFATTHSSDSEKWFVKALESIRSEEGLEEVDSAFIRLVSGDQGVYAIEYSEKLVKLAVEIGRELK